MGVISITQRSEKLGNIGSTGMAHGVTSTDIGTVRHHVAQTFSPRYFARHSHAGDAAIAHGLNAAADVFAKVALREDERQADQLVRQVMDNLDRMDRDERPFTPEAVGNNPDMQHVLGEQDEDGNYLNPQKRGIRLRTGQGVKTIVDETDQTYGMVFGGIADGMNASEAVRRKAHERLSSYQRGRVDWALNHQAAEYRRMELAGASDQLNSFIAAYKNGNSAVVGDIFEAREKLGILEGKTPEARKTDQQTLAVTLAGDLILEQTKKCASREDFDALADTVKNMDAKSTVLPEAIRSRLPEGKLGGKNEEAVLEQIRKAKSAFTLEQNRAEAEFKTKVKTAATEEVIKLHSNPVPDTDEGQAAYFYAQAEGYSRLAADPILRKTNPELAKSYAKTAEALRLKNVGTRHDAAFDALSNDFDAGFYFDENGNRMDYDAATMAETARKALADRRISRTQFNALMRKQAKVYDGEAAAFRDEVISDLQKLMPNLAYRNGRFAFKPTAKQPNVNATAASYDKPGLFSGDLEWSYGQLVQAMNLTLDWAKTQKNADATALKQHFDELTQVKDARRSVQQMGVEERLRREDDAVRTLQESAHRYQ